MYKVLKQVIENKMKCKISLQKQMGLVAWFNE